VEVGRLELVLQNKVRKQVFLACHEQPQLDEEGRRDVSGQDLCIGQPQLNQEPGGT
jgi:hypothetical protein